MFRTTTINKKRPRLRIKTDVIFYLKLLQEIALDNASITFKNKIIIAWYVWKIIYGELKKNIIEYTKSGK